MVYFQPRKCLDTYDAVMFVSHTLKSALIGGQEARIVHIDFSTVFDRVNHQAILYKVYSV